MKRSLLVFIALVLCLIVCKPAMAETDYIDPASRISFYYQYDGGARSVEGKWDALLADRLEALSGHRTIYPYSDQYLTGRGCCLFTFSHAYQYLCGYVSGDAAKANILYQYLSQKPLWSNKSSTLSPPNAASYYAAYLKKQTGVSQYSGSLSTFNLLKAFLAGGQSCVIVNAPGHYILATGCAVRGGVQYVLVVDSLLSATVRSDRLSYGMSLDFSRKITPALAGSLQAQVHAYWLPYSEFSDKCKLKYAFRKQAQQPISAEKDEFVLLPGTSAQIELKNAPERILYSSSDEDVCTVTETGLISAVSPGQAVIHCVSAQSSARSIEVYVYCARFKEEQTLVLSPGEDLPVPEFEGELPGGVSFEYDAEALLHVGVSPLEVAVLDPSLSRVVTLSVTAAVLESDALMELPGSLAVIEPNAFEGISAGCLAVPATVQAIGSGAFAGTPLRVVFLEGENTQIAGDAFDPDVFLCRDYAAYMRWKSRFTQ